MNAVTLGLAAAFVNAGQGLFNKKLTDRYPALPMIGVLLLLNCLVLLPFAPFVTWHWSPQILTLHVVSAFLLAMSSVPIWDLYDKGAASATTTAQALSPLAAALGAAVLVPGTTTAGQIVASTIVVIGVIWALQGAFVGLGRVGSSARIIVAATGFGLLTVTTRMLADEGAGVVETYVVRTAMAAAAMLLLIPPRGIPLKATPLLYARALITTTYFVLVILAVQEGSPVVVQTLIAITPIIILAVESLRSRTWPPRRATAGAVLVALGVALVLAL